MSTENERQISYLTKENNDSVAYCTNQNKRCKQTSLYNLHYLTLKKALSKKIHAIYHFTAMHSAP